MVNLQELASERSLAWIKVSITVVACWFLWREWRSPHQFSERAKKRFAGALAVLSLAAFFQFSHYWLGRRGPRRQRRLGRRGPRRQRRRERCIG